MRDDKDILELMHFFKSNQFFKDFKNQNGSEGLFDWIEKLSYLTIPKGKFVMKQGDFGDMYYIILKGRTSVMLNMDVKYEISIPPIQNLPESELNSKIQEFISFYNKIIERNEFIIDNEAKQHFLFDLNVYFPGSVKTKTSKENKTEYFIDSKLSFINI